MMTCMSCRMSQMSCRIPWMPCIQSKMSRRMSWVWVHTLFHHLLVRARYTRRSIVRTDTAMVY